MYPHSNLDKAYDVDYVTSKVPQTEGMGFRWKNRSVLVESKFTRPHVSKKEFKALRALKLNKDIVIRLTDKAGYSMVLDESEYKNKFVSIRAE
jgi:hypothetical protein